MDNFQRILNAKRAELRTVTSEAIALALEDAVKMTIAGVCAARTYPRPPGPLTQDEKDMADLLLPQVYEFVIQKIKEGHNER